MPGLKRIGYLKLESWCAYLLNNLNLSTRYISLVLVNAYLVMDGYARE